MAMNEEYTNESQIKRLMPNDQEAEQAVIGSMLMDRNAIVTAIETLVKEDFYQHLYGTLFEAIKELFDADIAVDMITLQNKLREQSVPPEYTSLEYIKDILDKVPTSANVRYYVRIVRDMAVLRELIKTMEVLENECYAREQPMPVILEDIEKKIFRIIQESRGDTDYVDIKDIVLGALKKIEVVAKTEGSITGIATGFKDLDYRTAGLQPSDLILVAARPSMGKTAFVLNIAQHVAFRNDTCTAIFSLEMSKEQLVNRLFALEGHIDAQKIRAGSLGD